MQQMNSELKFLIVERHDEEKETFIDEKVHMTSKYYTLSNGKQCIGGIMTTDREKIFKDSLFNSFTGCYISVSVSLGSSFEQINLNQDLHKSEFKYHNVEADCPNVSDQCEIKNSLYPSYIKFELEPRNFVDSENFALSFSSLSHNGVLLYRVQDDNQLLLKLNDGSLTLTVYEPSNSFSIKSQSKNLNDNNLHHVLISIQDNKIGLYVDNLLQSSRPIQPLSVSNKNELYISGAPVDVRLPYENFPNFEGCLVQVIYNDRILDLSKAADKASNIKFSKCYRGSLRSNLDPTGFQNFPNQPVLSRYSQKIKKTDYLLNQECGLKPNYDTTMLRPIGLRFGLTKQSRMEVVENLPIKLSSFISFKFRTLESNGLMFYASDIHRKDFIAVWIQNGFINFAFDCGSGLMHIKTKRIYSDGRYHTLIVKRDMQLGTLTVADRTNTTILETTEDTSPGDMAFLNAIEPYYFGNLKQEDKTNLPQAQKDLISIEPFIGCMSDFNVGYKFLGNKVEQIDLMSCSNSHESGIFFSGKNEYASLNNELSLDEAFELSIDLKSRTKNGVLLYMGEKQIAENYFLLELVNGELELSFVLNGHKNMVKYTPNYSRNELCNASWVKLRLKKTEKGIISLDLRGSESNSGFSKNLSALNKKSSYLSTLYVGALPDPSLYSEISQTNQPYIGCIRDFELKKIKNGLISSQRNILLDMRLSSGLLTYCPLK